MRKFVLLLPTILLATAALAVTPVMPRYPTPSPDGSQIVFSWNGDLWLVPASGGTARRLTASPGYDHHPVFSADGRSLAFVSDRAGSDDVYLITASRGFEDAAAPVRLTFHEAPDLVEGFVGSSLLFTSRRHEAWDRQPAVYEVPLSGGTEKLALKELALEARPSPDGRWIALVRGGTPADRRHYRGAANRDLWLVERATGSLRRLTDTPWDEDGVAWAGAGALVYRSDGGGTDRNLYRMDLATKAITQLTNHSGSDVRNPATSADGRLAAYELWDGVYVVPTDGSVAPRRLDVAVSGDTLEPETIREIEKAGAQEVVVSPDGTQVALVVGGDIYVVPRWSRDVASVAAPPTVRVTNTVAREGDVTWRPDGKELVYVSGRNGEADLYAVTPADRDDGLFYRASRFTERRLTATPEDEHLPRFSPDGKHLAYRRGQGDLVVAGPAAEDPRVVFTHWSAVEFDWSPDSAWLAFSKEDASFNTDVFIIPAAGGTAVNVSQHPGDDVHPRWSPDGRRLYWVSDRHQRAMDLWGVYLTKADYERSPEEWVEAFQEAGDSPSPRRGGRGPAARKARAEEAAAPSTVHIDFDGLYLRAEALTELPGNEGEFAVSPDSRTVVFTASPEGERDLYSVRWDGKKLKRLTDGGQNPREPAFAGGSTIVYRSGKGTVGVVDLDGKRGDPVPFAARVEYGRDAMRAEVFDEAWRELDRQFYDPAFHGADWTAVHDRYRPLVLGAPARRDFDDAVNLMLGELNASHMGFRPPRADGTLSTGDLGVEVEPAPGGAGVVVTEVLPNTPASRVDVGLARGDRILAVDGAPVGLHDNFFARMADTRGQTVVLRVAGPAGERDVVVTPVGQRDVRQARYVQWVRERRAMVDRLSGGKLGYIHIQGMNMPSLEEFERDLYAAGHGKEGLLIDVRNNGGGSTTDYLMAILEVRRHAWTLPRGGDPAVKGYPQDRLPLPAWTRPAALLCDQASYSNAEIFSWAFKTLKRGPVVGMPTFGAVISTGGARLVDGSFVRLPRRGWYVAGSDVNMEHHGCPPDVLVPQPPEQDLSADADAQLERAVEVLLSDLPADPSALPW